MLGRTMETRRSETMAIRGPKPDHLKLVDATESIPDEICGAATQEGRPCRRKAGWGTDHDSGRCKHHQGVLEDGMMECPLPTPGGQAAIWADLVKRLEAVGTFHPAYWPVLYGLVVAINRLQEADASVDDPVVMGSNGYPKKHPGISVTNAMLSHVRSYCAELGLTPSAVVKLGVHEGKEELSTLDKLIKG